MAQELIDAMKCTRALFAGAAGLALAVMVPLLAAPTTNPVGVALAALVVGLLLSRSHQCVVLTAREAPVRAAGPSGPRIQLHGSVTDPRHYPLRPRAPGMA